MTQVVVIGLPGEAEFWVADLGAGTVTKHPVPKSGALADANTLRQAGVVITKGVNLAVAVGSKDSTASGQLDAIASGQLVASGQLDG